MGAPTIKSFIIKRVRKNAPLLLALSGGSDSMALLYLLLDLQKQLPLYFEIAHVDHGWRRESAEEAELLRALAKSLGIPFHFKRLDPMEGGNLEERCRFERLAFFRELFAQRPFQAALLGHHSGDQAETLFKRIAEGAGMRALGGLKEEVEIEGVLLWRPLLSYTKKELCAYLERRGGSYFEDATNCDPTYLRARLRTSLFPEMERRFGKGVQRNLVRLGARMQEVSNYLDGRVEKIERRCIASPFGSCLPLLPSFHPVELQHFLGALAPFSADAMERLLALITSGAFQGRIDVKATSFEISRAHLFIYKRPFPSFFSCRFLWEEGEGGDWRAFWRGFVRPKEGGSPLPLSALSPAFRKRVKEVYRSCAVPAFFYEKAPLYLEEGRLYETLTGKGKTFTIKDSPQGSWLSGQTF